MSALHSTRTKCFCLNVGAGMRQQFRDCSGRGGAERQNIAATFDSACRRPRVGWRLGVHRLAGAGEVLLLCMGLFCKKQFRVPPPPQGDVASATSIDAGGSQSILSGGAASGNCPALC